MLGQVHLCYLYSSLYSLEVQRGNSHKPTTASPMSCCSRFTAKHYRVPGLSILPRHLGLTIKTTSYTTGQIMPRATQLPESARHDARSQAMERATTLTSIPNKYWLMWLMFQITFQDVTQSIGYLCSLPLPRMIYSAQPSSGPKSCEHSRYWAALWK